MFLLYHFGDDKKCLSCIFHGDGTVKVVQSNDLSASSLLMPSLSVSGSLEEVAMNNSFLQQLLKPLKTTSKENNTVRNCFDTERCQLLIRAAGNAAQTFSDLSTYQKGTVLCVIIGTHRDKLGNLLVTVVDDMNAMTNILFLMNQSVPIGTVVAFANLHRDSNGIICCNNNSHIILLENSNRFISYFVEAFNQFIPHDVWKRYSALHFISHIMHKQKISFCVRVLYSCWNHLCCDHQFHLHTLYEDEQVLVVNL